MHCTRCRDFPSLADKSSALFKGTSSFRTDSLSSHEVSVAHQSCSVRHLNSLKTEGGEKSLVSLASHTALKTCIPISKALHTLSREQMARLKPLFNTAFGIAKAGKPASNFKLMCAIQMKNGLNMGKNYLNRFGYTKFLTAYGDIIKETQSCPFVSVLSDGSTDKAIVEQELVYVRYVPESTRLPITRMVQIVPLPSGSAEGVYSAVVQALASVGLPMYKLGLDAKDCPSLVCANFDGASVNFGCKSGVATRLKAVFPDIVAIHCIAHKLELAVLDASKTVKYMSQFETTLKSIYSLYHYSPKRRRELSEIAALLNTSLAHFSSVKQVRWLSSKARAIDAVKQNLGSVASHLEHDAAAGIRADDSNKVNGILTQMTSVPFLRMLHFLLDYLPIVSELSRAFQTEDVLVIQMPPLIETTLVKLAVLKAQPGKNMKAFQARYDATTRTFGDLKLSTPNCRSFD